MIKISLAFSSNRFRKFFLILALFSCVQINAQVSGSGIFFQAIARDNYSNPAKDRSIYVEASIIQNTANGTKVLTELHKTNTDGSGVFSISVGNGTRLSGTANKLNDIEWQKGPYYLGLKIAIQPISPIANWDYSKELIDLGASPFGTVPYALYAGNSGSIDGKLNISDTSAMLAPYKQLINNVANNISNNNTNSINKLIDGKLNIADSITKYVTPSQLANKTFDSTAIYNQLSLKANSTDITNLNTALTTKANITDVSNSLASKANLIDVTTALNTKANTLSVTADLLTKEDAANKSTNVTTDGSSNTKFPSVKAVKDYVDAQIVSSTTIADGSITDAKISTVSGSKVTGNISGNAANITGNLAITNGGTGATSAAGARTNLGLVIGTDVQAPLSFTTPINKNGNTVSLSQATTSVDGYLSAADFTSFNNKIDATQKAANNGVATLGNDGKIPSNQIPAISFQSANVVNNQLQMLQLSNAVVGSIAIRTDVNENYVLSALPASTQSNWIRLLSPTSVTSVNGNAGPNVTLTTNDVAEGSNNKYYTDARVRGSINAATPLSFNSSTGTISMTTASASSNGYLSSTDFTTFNNKQNAITAGVDYLAPNGSAAALTNFPTLNQNTTGNAATATKLAATRNINGVAFDGSTNITVPADGSTLSGSTLASNITASSLTSVGTITSGVWSGTTIAIAKGGTGATTATAALTNLGAEPTANKSTATDLGALNPSDVLFPSQKAVKTYVDLQSANAGVADGSITNAKLNGGITYDKLAGNIPTSKLVGTDIATVGTITSGTWSGTTIAIANGGTGATSAAGARANLGLVIGTNVMAANAITTLTGDVTGAGNGSFSTTVNSVGGVSSSTISGFDTRITTSANNIASNTSSITTLNALIASNTSSINTLNTNVASNTASITQNIVDISLKSPIISPALTGVPTAPTASVGTNSAQLATTAFVNTAISNYAPTTALNIAGGIAGNIPYQTSPGTTGFIPNGSANQFLTATGSGTYTWTSASGVTGNYVPYSGATQAVNLGAYDLTVNGITVGRGGGAAASHTAFGANALSSISSSTFNNVAIGSNAYKLNTNGGNNTVVGADALKSSVNDNGYNTVIGASSFQNYNETAGGRNTSLGTFTGQYITTGQRNVVLGYNAGVYYGSGTSNLTSQSNSVLIGYYVRPLANGGDNEVVIAGATSPSTGMVGNGSNTVTIGNNSTTGNFFKGNLTLTGNVIGGTWSGSVIGNNYGGAGTSSGLLKANGTGVVSAAISGTDYLVPNGAITGSTGTKITYDSKGLVTAGANATTADISPSTNRNYVTDVQAGVISNTSGINTGDQTITLTGDVTGTGTGTFTSTLANTGVTANTYGSATLVPILTVDSKGRITNASTTSINAGVNTLTYTSGTSYVNGGTVSGTTLTLAAADGSNPGLISTGAQTIAGAKTFNNDITAPTFIGALSGNAITATTATTAGNITATTNTTLTSLANLNTVGTITSGTWSGTAIAIVNGGTGATTKTAAFDALSPMTTSGDLIYGAASGTGTRLGVGTTGQVLTISSGLPSWATPTGVTSIGAISGTATPTGATITSGVLNLTPADASNGGIITTGSQTFAGAKTFNSNLNVTALTIGKGSGTGADNTALGVSVLSSNTSGMSNTGVGSTSLTNNSSGHWNTAVGYGSLNSNTTGMNNVAVGSTSMYNKEGTNSGNVGVGSNTLRYVRGGYNVAIGNDAGANLGSSSTNVGENNVFIGASAGQFATSGNGTNNLRGRNSVLIGYDVRPNADDETNEIVIAGYTGTNQGQSGLGSNTTSIGNSATTDTRIFGKLILPNTTASTSTTTGALIVGGGVGIAGNTYIGGTISIAGGSPGLGKVLTSDANGLASWSTVSGSGVSTLTYTTATSYSTGGTISGSTLTLTPADASNPGLISTGAQSFAGAKTFTSALTVAPNVAAINTNGATTSIAAQSATSTTYNGGGVIITSGNGGSSTGNAGNINLNAGSGGGYGGNINLTPGTGSLKGVVQVIGSDLFVYDASFRVGHGNGSMNSNTAVGYQAINSVNTGGSNTAFGFSTLTNTTSGSSNTAIGSNALTFNNIGSYNTAVGQTALKNNTSGTQNSALGVSALGANTTGGYNVAIGFYSLGSVNSTNNYNTAIGHSALRYSSADNNTAIGYNAGGNMGFNGTASVTGGANNIFLGYNAGSMAGSTTSSTPTNATGYNSVMIGSDVRPKADGDYNEIVISGYTGTTPGAVGQGSNTTSIGNTSTQKSQIYGALTIVANTAAANMTGTSSTIAAQDATTATYGGGNLNLTAGNAGTTGLGGNIILTPGTSTTTANNGIVQVNGLLKITGGTPAAGSVLTSDANGLASWAAASSGGVSALTYTSTTSYANGGSISGSTLTLAAASTTNPGLISSGAQSIAGVKTFVNSITVSPTAVSGSNGTSTTLAAQSSNIQGGDVNITAGNSGNAYNGGNINLTPGTTGGSPGVNGAVNINNADLYVNGITVGRGSTNISTNTTFGYQAMYQTSFGSNNITAIGYRSLINNSGSNNTAVGYSSLAGNSGSYNTGVGESALNSNSASYNSAFGYQSLLFNTSGQYNVAVGANAAYANTTASNITAIGYNSLKANKTGADVTAVGYNSLTANVNGSNNTAIGSNALSGNISGTTNTAVGYNALKLNVSTGQNTAIGSGALQNNTAANNTAVGANVLSGNVSGTLNAGLGLNALYSNSTGNNNTASGALSLRWNLSGSDNSAYGQSAGLYTTTGSQNVYLGSGAGQNITTASNNIFIGYNAGMFYNTYQNNSNTTGDGNVMIGKDVRPSADGQSNQIVIAGYAGSGDGMIGNGSNTTTIGNNSTEATYLKGVLNVSPNYAAANTDGLSTTISAQNAGSGTKLGGNLNLWAGDGTGGSKGGDVYIRLGSSSTDANKGSLLVNTTEKSLISSYSAAGVSILVPAGHDGLTLKSEADGNNLMNLWQLGTNSNNMIAFHKGVTGQGSAAVVGTINVTTTATTYNTTSDYRLKTDFKDFNASSLMDSIKVYDYQWKINGTRSYGVKAHELQSVLPYAVSGAKDAVNADGSINPQSVDYSKIVPVLIKAIQEQKIQMKEKQDRIDALELRLKKIEEKLNQ